MFGEISRVVGLYPRISSILVSCRAGVHSVRISEGFFIENRMGVVNRGPEVTLYGCFGSHLVLILPGDPAIDNGDGKRDLFNL